MKYLLFIFLLHPICSFSQKTIKGVIQNNRGEKVSGASVTINEVGKNTILSYTLSNNKGEFLITFLSNSKKVEINVRFMGYEFVKRTILNTSQNLRFSLKEKVFKLEEIIVKTFPITRKGDTINYNISSFTSLKDRTIADILDKIPGIEVLENGKILYQGKPINKYYINGLDLLEGKYNLANKNLPYKEVSKVQILENHQPIKILDSLVFSENAAVNIKLKNSYTFTGQSSVGLGVTPLIWDTNITPMLFSKNKQVIISYQANNNGNDIASQLNTLTLEDLLEQFENNTKKQDWLSIYPLSKPSFSKKRWFNNNTNLISANYLQKLQKEYQLRVNISYLNDYQQEKGFIKTRFFTTDTNYLINEKIHNRLFFNSFKTNITLEKNTKKRFLKNSLKFQGFWDNQQGNILLNNTPIIQKLSNQYFNFSNNLSTIFPIGKQLVSLKSFVGFSKTPQSLSINPGQLESILNNNIPYENVFQRVDFNNFITNNNLSFTKGWNRFTFQSKFGVLIEKQKLSSTISVNQNNILNADFSNRLFWNKSQFYTNLTTQYQKNKWRLNFETKLNLYSFKIHNNSVQKKQTILRRTFNPKISINYKLTNFWKLNTSVNISNYFGNIHQLYYAYILENYRTIKRNDTPLNEQHKQNYSFGIFYRNPLKSFFGNLSYNFINTNKNLLIETQILNNGALSIGAFEKDNRKISHDFSIKLSKYLSSIKTSVTLNSNLNFNSYFQIINANIINVNNKINQIGGKIDIDFTNWFNVKYKPNILFLNNRIEEKKLETIKRNEHLLEMNIYPKEGQYLGIKTEFVKTNFSSQTVKNIFTDIFYRFTLTKRKIDFELQWNNLFNVNNYQTVNITEFSYLETNFKLRPSQVLFKIRFSL